MKIFVTDRNYVTKEVAKRFDCVDNLLDADVLVTWTDITKTENDQVILAKELNIPSVVIQHGRRAIVDYLPDYEDINSCNTKQKITADYFCCWGQADYDDLIKIGYSKDMIKLTGSPLVPNVPDKRTPELITFLSHHDVRKDALIYNHEIHNILVKKYGKKRVKLMGKDLPIYNMVISQQYDNEKLEEYVCLHKNKVVYESEINEKKLDKKNLTDLSYAKCRLHSADQNTWRKMAAIFMNTKVCVSVMPSSFEGLACVMDIPIVRVKCDWGARNTKGGIDFELNEAVEAVDIKDLIKTIESIDPDKRREGRKKIAKSDMCFKGSAIDNIERVIKDAHKNNNPS